jgi:hypothetical protein
MEDKKMAAMMAMVTPCASGFGMYEVGERCFMWSDPEDRKGDAKDEVRQYIRVSKDYGYIVEKYDALDGMIQGQNAGEVYRFWPQSEIPDIDRGNVKFFIVWEEEIEEDAYKDTPTPMKIGTRITGRRSPTHQFCHNWDPEAITARYR